MAYLQALSVITFNLGYLLNASVCWLEYGNPGFGGIVPKVVSNRTGATIICGGAVSLLVRFFFVGRSIRVAVVQNSSLLILAPCFCITTAVFAFVFTVVLGIGAPDASLVDTYAVQEHWRVSMALNVGLACDVILAIPVAHSLYTNKVRRVQKRDLSWLFETGFLIGIQQLFLKVNMAGNAPRELCLAIYVLSASISASSMLAVLSNRDYRKKDLSVLVEGQEPFDTELEKSVRQYPATGDIA